MVPKPPATWPYGVALVLGFVLCGLAALTVGQDNNWDLRNYHYYNPHAFLNDRVGYDFAPAQRQSYFNPFLDLPHYWGTRHLPARVFAFLLGGVQGLAFGLVFAIAAIVFRRFAGNTRWMVAGLCALAGVHAPVFIGELGATENDTVVSLFVLVSLVLLVRALATHGSLSGRSARRALFAGSLILGIGVGLKGTVMSHAFGVAIAAVFTERTWRARVATAAIASAGLVGGFLLSNGYWMMRMWEQFENPMFPFCNDIFKSPWADPRHYNDRSMIPASWAEAVAYPFQFRTHSSYTDRQHDFRDVRYAWLVVIAAAWLFERLVHSIWTRSRPAVLPVNPDLRFLVVFFVVSFVAWEASFAIIRYTAALEVVAPILIVAGLCASHGPKVTKAVAAAMLAVLVSTVEPIHHERLPFERTFWDVQVPELPSAHAIVVIAVDRPLAYLIPFFPNEVRWISVDNNLTRPSAPTKAQKEIRKVLGEFDGDIYLLSRNVSGWGIESDLAVMQLYGLGLDDTDELPITSKHTESSLFLRRLTRLSADDPAQSDAPLEAGSTDSDTH